MLNEQEQHPLDLLDVIIFQRQSQNAARKAETRNAKAGEDTVGPSECRCVQLEKRNVTYV